jgi:hypothetical protein
MTKYALQKLTIPPKKNSMLPVKYCHAKKLYKMIWHGLASTFHKYGTDATVKRTAPTTKVIAVKFIN